MNKNNRIIVLGAGVLGLAVAIKLRELKYKNIIICEKEADVGVHASGRNSGVLHAGIYYTSETQKARFCLEGNQAWKSFCKEHKLPLLECGKTLVARHAQDLEQLHIIYDRAIENGTAVQWLSEEYLKFKEPLAKTYQKALWVEDTAVVDSRAILKKMKSILIEDGVDFHFNCRFLKKTSQSEISTSLGHFEFDYLINAAGAFSDKIAHDFNVAKHLRLIPFQGLYYELSSMLSSKINSHIYPVPDLRNPFLGIHFTKSITGKVYLGPTAIPAFGPEQYGLGTGFFNKEMPKIVLSDILLFLKNKKFRSVALSEPKYYLKHFFHKKAAELVTQLDSKEILPTSKIGIRPQLVNWQTKELMMDFHLEKTNDSLHILNAISPAFTCALPFASFICKQI